MAKHLSQKIKVGTFVKIKSNMGVVSDIDFDLQQACVMMHNGIKIVGYIRDLGSITPVSPEEFFSFIKRKGYNSFYNEIQNMEKKVKIRFLRRALVEIFNRELFLGFAEKQKDNSVFEEEIFEEIKSGKINANSISDWIDL